MCLNGSSPHAFGSAQSRLSSPGVQKRLVLPLSDIISASYRSIDLENGSPDTQASLIKCFSSSRGALESPLKPPNVAPRP